MQLAQPWAEGLTTNRVVPGISLLILGPGHNCFYCPPFTSRL